MSIKDYILQHYSSIDEFATILQDKAIIARELLFCDPILGYDYSAAGIRTDASVKDIEETLYKESFGLVKFTLCSHRHLLINICDEPTIPLYCPNEYSPTNTNDSSKNNPYRKIAKIITNTIHKIMNNEFAPQKFDIQDVSTSIQEQAINTIAKLSTLTSYKDKKSEIREFEDYVSDVSDGNIELSIHTCKSGGYKVDFKPWETYKDIHDKRTPGIIAANKTAMEIIKTWNETTSNNVETCPTLPTKTTTPVVVENPSENNVNTKYNVNDVIAMLTTSIISTLGMSKKNPFIGILSFYGHRVEDIVSDLSNDVLSYKLENDVITISNSKGLSMTVSTTTSSVNDIGTNVAEALKTILVASMMNKELSEMLSKHIDTDSVKALLDVPVDSTEVIIEDESGKSNVVNNSSNHNDNTEAIHKFNSIFADSYKAIEDAILDDNKSSFNKVLSGLLRKCVNKAGYNGKQGIPDLCGILTPTNRTSLKSLYDVCDQKWPFKDIA